MKKVLFITILVSGLLAVSCVDDFNDLPTEQALSNKTEVSSTDPVDENANDPTEEETDIQLRSRDGAGEVSYIPGRPR